VHRVSVILLRQCLMYVSIYVSETSNTSVVCLMLLDEDVLQLQKMLNTVVSARLLPSVRSDKVRTVLV